MRINAKIIKNVADVNQWEYANVAYVQEGQSNEIYIQLVDLDKTHSAEKSTALPEFPLRYMPQGTVVTLTATFPNIDSDEQFTITGAQPFADDKSIWRLPLTATDIPASGNFIITLTEDGVEKTFLIRNALSVELVNVGGC